MSAAFEAAAFRDAADATDTQMADMQSYKTLLQEWSSKMNLVGPSAMEHFWLRHAWDSAQLISHAPAALIWADIGAGAGFPGLVLAILLKGRPGAQVHLVESMTKRCRFLSEAVRCMSLPAVVHNERAEQSDLKGIEVVTARACAPMPRLLGFAEPLLSRDATGLFLKGEGVAAELGEARSIWRFDAELIPSRSDPSGKIVQVRNLARG